MSKINFILGGDSITVFLDGKSYTINKQADTYDAVLAAVRASDENKLRDAVNIRQSIVKALNSKSGKVRIEGSSIFYGDREITGLVATRVFDVIKLGLDVTPMVRFIENLMLNPSKRAVDELFLFLDACRLPITADGHFLAYKRVRGDYHDVHSGTMDNSVGNILEMPRNLVDEDKNRTCSAGLHFCSYDYLAHFGGERIVALKINPADVVAIPADYNNSKGRTCRYEVVSELPLDEYRMPATKIADGYTNEFDNGWNDPEVDSDENEEEWDESEDESWEESWDESDEDSDESEDDELPVKATQVASVNTTGKLTPADVRLIRRRLSQGDSLAQIGRDFDVSPRTIGRIRDGEAWSNI